MSSSSAIARRASDPAAPFDEACQSSAEIQERLALEGAHVDRFYAMGDKAFASILHEAAKEWPIVGERSFFIGAAEVKAEAARRAGLAAHVFDGSDLTRVVRSILTQSGAG